MTSLSAPRTLAELRKDYLATNPNVQSGHTIRLLQTSEMHFRNYLRREPLLSDLTDRNMAGFIRHRQGLGRADATVEREAAKLMCLWRYAASRAWALPPMIRIEKAKPGEPVAFLRHELRLLFRGARRYDTQIVPGSHGGRRVGERPAAIQGGALLYPLLWVLWDTAERIGALCEVKREDFRPSYGWFGRINGGWLTITARKGGGRPMTRKLRRTTAVEIMRLLEMHQHPKLFGVIHRGTMYYHLEKLLRQCGLPTDRKHKFHCMRRSHASYLKRSGGDATDSLGDSSEEITRVRYFDRRITQRRQHVDYLFSPLGIMEGFWGLFR